MLLFISSALKLPLTSYAPSPCKEQRGEGGATNKLCLPSPTLRPHSGWPELFDHSIGFMVALRDSKGDWLRAP